jgi:hypothetical protein
MKKAMGSWRPLVAVVLVSVMLALPLHHVAAEQRQQYLPLSPYTPQGEREEPSSAARWLGWAFVAGLVWCALTGCVGGDSDGGAQGSPATQDPWRRWKEEGHQPKPEFSRPDTSIGCAWGDRASGTCVK